MDDEDMVEVTVKVPVSITIRAPRYLAEESDGDDLREIAGAAIERSRLVHVHWHSEEIACTIGPYWDVLPAEGFETTETESGSWGEA